MPNPISATKKLLAHTEFRSTLKTFYVATKMAPGNLMRQIRMARQATKLVRPQATRKADNAYFKATNSVAKVFAEGVQQRHEKAEAARNAEEAARKAEEAARKAEELPKAFVNDHEEMIIKEKTARANAIEHGEKLPKSGTYKLDERFYFIPHLIALEDKNQDQPLERLNELSNMQVMQMKMSLMTGIYQELIKTHLSNDPHAKGNLDVAMMQRLHAEIEDYIKLPKQPE
ncbi:MAG: hypothetical protein EON54_06965 [Alcaligenaceae bacterium]|nr:MAG: hypothetical protein EON54_06965 [Alcaligenaceae bacterium]